jgi:hypothetical protein
MPDPPRGYHSAQRHPSPTTNGAPMTETPEAAYTRGETAGGIRARLEGHDRHFAAINGHLADLALEMHQLTLAVQRLGDQAEASAATVITTAAALKAADDARRREADRSWSPVAKALAVVGGIAALLAAAVSVYAVTRNG